MVRITQGSGSRRNTTIICGATKNAQGHPVKALVNERTTVAGVLRRVLFSNNASFHKAERSLATWHSQAKANRRVKLFQLVYHLGE